MSELDQLQQFIDRIRHVVTEQGLTWYESGVSREEEPEFCWMRVDRSLIGYIDEGEPCLLQVKGPNMYRDMFDYPGPTDKTIVFLWKWLWNKE